MRGESDFANDRPSPSLRWLALVAALCAIVLVLLAIAVGHGPLPLDLAVRDALHVGGSVPLVLDALNIAGGALVWDAGLALVVGALFLAGRRIDAAWLGGGVLAAETVATVIKLVVDRPRPPGIGVIDLVTQASFPSGHVTRTAVTFALLVLLIPADRRDRTFAAAAALVVIVLMGLARIVSGEHWPTDVLGGYLVSGLVVVGAVAVRTRFRWSVPAPRRPGGPDPGGAAPPP